MKIVTNIRFYTVAGIAQYLSTLIQHNEGVGSAHIYGIDVLHPAEQQDAPSFDPRAMRYFSLLTPRVKYPAIGEILENARDIEDVRAAMKPVIEAYARHIREIKPDYIVINGTYAMPWSLLQAAQAYGRAHIVIHYHGVLTKETAHWDNEKHKAIMAAMEREFDVPEAFYIFPSALARAAVEREVYGHPILQSVVLPNPVPEHFFEIPQRPRKATPAVGMVARWTPIKNVKFLVSLARHAKRAQAGFSFPIVTNLTAAHKDYAGAAPHLDVRDPLPHADLPSFYQALGVLILPSHFETYGNVAGEALAAGTPVLVSAAAGVAETFHLIGLGSWVRDFSSTAAIFEAAAHLAGASVPIHARLMLQQSFGVAAVFKKYFGALKDLA